MDYRQSVIHSTAEAFRSQLPRRIRSLLVLTVNQMLAAEGMPLLEPEERVELDAMAEDFLGSEQAGLTAECRASGTPKDWPNSRRRYRAVVRTGT